MHSGHKQSIQVAPIVHHTETELSWPESDSPRVMLDTRLEELSNAVNYYLNQVTNDVPKSQLSQLDELEKADENERILKILSSSQQQQPKQFLLDSIPDLNLSPRTEPDTSSVQDRRKSCQRSNSQKLTTLVEFVSQEDLSDDSPPRQQI